MGKVTNKCAVCEVQYRLPASADDMRNWICFTCELNFGALDAMIQAILVRRSTQSKVEGGEYFQRLMENMREFHKQSAKKKSDEKPLLAGLA